MYRNEENSNHPAMLCEVRFLQAIADDAKISACILRGFTDH